MATIANLAVKLTAKTAAFTSGMRGATATVKTFATDVHDISLKVLKFGSIMASAGVAIATYYTRQAFKAVDATAKLSDRIGITTEGLQKLRLAAELSGGSVEGIDNALQQFVRRTAEARAGLMTYKRAFDMLGLSAEAVAKMDTAEAFMLVADRIRGLTNYADKASAAYNLFGRQGMALLNMLNQGKAGIKEISKSIDGMGIAFSRVDAAKIEAANDAITRLRWIANGAWVQIAAFLAPGIMALEDVLSTAIRGSDALGRSFATTFGDVIVGAIGAVGDAIDVIDSFFLRVVRNFNMFMMTIRHLRVEFSKWYKSLPRWLAIGAMGGAGLALAAHDEPTTEKSIAKNKAWVDASADELARKKKVAEARGGLGERAQNWVLRAIEKAQKAARGHGEAVAKAAKEQRKFNGALFDFEAWVAAMEDELARRKKEVMATEGITKALRIPYDFVTGAQAQLVGAAEMGSHEASITQWQARNTQGAALEGIGREQLQVQKNLWRDSQTQTQLMRDGFGQRVVMQIP